MFKKHYNISESNDSNSQETIDNIFNNSPKKKQKKFHFSKMIIVYFIFVLSIIMFITMSVILINWNNDNKNIKEETKEINSIIKNENNDNNNNEEININPPSNVSNDYWDFIKTPFNDINFEKLLTINTDTVAWVKVNNTNINYPVVQSTDNEYYLTHSFKNKNNDAGWIFMDYRNTNFKDKNTIIYGHSRLDRSMFGSLKNILTKSWYTNKDNHIIYVSTPTENSLWQVFSTYSIETENYYLTTNFSSNNEYEKFLTTLTNRSIYNYNATPNINDKILTLSTCHNKTEKIVLHAKLIKIQKK